MAEAAKVTATVALRVAPAPDETAAALRAAPGVATAAVAQKAATAPAPRVARTAGRTWSRRHWPAAGRRACPGVKGGELRQAGAG